MTLSPKNTDVKSLFNTIAPEYDKMNNIISLGAHKKLWIKWSFQEKRKSLI